jgi:16S rRNA processing protein RimM
LAKLLRPQGRRGELLADLETDLRELFTDGLPVSLSKTQTPSDDPDSTTLESHFFPTGRNAGRIVVKLAGSNSISEAELLAGSYLLVPATELPLLEADTWFVRDLLGCTLFDGETLVGEIVDVEFATTPDGRSRLADGTSLLVIERPAAKSHEAEEANEDNVLVPFLRAWLLSVDIPGKRIKMNLPAGLLDPL